MKSQQPDGTCPVFRLILVNHKLSGQHCMVDLQVRLAMQRGTVCGLGRSSLVQLSSWDG